MWMLFLGMFFDRGVMGLSSTQGDEKRLLFSNHCRWRHRPPLCHLDRSAAKWRDLRFSGPFSGMFFDRAEVEMTKGRAMMAQGKGLRKECSELVPGNEILIAPDRTR